LQQFAAFNQQLVRPGKWLGKLGRVTNADEKLLSIELDTSATLASQFNLLQLCMFFSSRKLLFAFGPIIR